MLLEDLHSAPTANRLARTEALGGLLTPDIVPALDRLVRQDPDVDVRAAAARSLGRAQETAVRSLVLDSLLAATADPDSEVREAAFAALLAIDAIAAARPVALENIALDRPSPSAMRLLGLAGERAAIGRLAALLQERDCSAAAADVYMAVEWACHIGLFRDETRLGK